MTTPDIQKNIINRFVIKFLSDHINSSKKQENIDAWKNEENQE